jgi:hypothetical protein
MSCTCRFLAFNSLTEHRTEVVNVLVSSMHVSVVDSEGKPVVCQLNPQLNRELHISSDKFEVHTRKHENSSDLTLDTMVVVLAWNPVYWNKR